MANTQVKCPYCGKPALFAPENPNRPFCSERCKMIDLGHWADEKYAVPVAPAVDLGDDFDSEDPGAMSNPGEPAPDEDASSPLH